LAFEIEHISINPGGSSNLPLFAEINGGQRGRENVGRARFDFDKTEGPFIESDQVDFTGNLNTFSISTYRGPKISRNKAKSSPPQVIRRGFFAEFANSP
jgi:hypothetical protein